MKQLMILFILAITIFNSQCGFSINNFLEDECSFFENEKKSSCELLYSGDVSKKCSFYNNQCIITYKSCSDYKENIQKDICESISIEGSPDKKCVFENGECIEKDRNCSDFKLGLDDTTLCYHLHSTDENKFCIFKNNKCEEQYKACEDYKENVDKDICESIQPFDSDFGIELDKKCVYENGKCVGKERYCSEYNYDLGVYRYICESLSASDESKICALVNNKCIEQFADCEDYEGKDKDICESILPSPEEGMKCVLEGDKCISKKKTSCSDYILGLDREYCSYIVLEDSAKTCLFHNNVCIETYKTCEDYLGNEKEICESILPTYGKDEMHFLDYESKCVFDEEKKSCKTEVRYCDEAFKIQNLYGKFCDSISPRDENKICLSYKNKCIETYATCEDYQENVEKDKCEAIIPEEYENVKCVYDEDNKKCISQNLECSSFIIESIKYTCELLGKEINKTCVYSDGFCYEKHEAGETDKADKTEETDKTDEINKTDETDKTDKTDETDKTDKTEETDKTDKINKTDETNETDKADETGKADKKLETDKTDEINETDKNDKTDKIDKNDKTDKTDTNAAEDLNYKSDKSDMNIDNTYNDKNNNTGNSSQRIDAPLILLIILNLIKFSLV